MAKQREAPRVLEFQGSFAVEVPGKGVFQPGEIVPYDEDLAGLWLAPGQLMFKTAEKGADD